MKYLKCLFSPINLIYDVFYIFKLMQVKGNDLLRIKGSGLLRMKLPLSAAGSVRQPFPIRFCPATFSNP